MKNFWGSFLGVFLALIVIGLFVIVTLVSVLVTSQDKSPLVVKSNSILLLQLSGEIADRGRENQLSIPQLDAFLPPNKLGLNTIVKALEHAKTDENIKGVVLNIKGMQAGFAVLKEIRDAILNFKSESNKFVYAYNDSYAQGNYYISSAADSIFMNPAGEIELKGLNYQTLFFTEALERLGLEPQIIRHGTFKAAVEPFMLKSMSEANKQQSQAYIDAVWSMYLSDVSLARSVSVNRINELINTMQITGAQAAVDHKLIDGLLYRDQFIDKILTLTHTDKESELNLLTASKYAESVSDAPSHNKQRIAILYGSGEIRNGKGNDEVITSQDFAKSIRQVREDSTIKAVVLRINSPGGDALASEIIWREIQLTKAQKTVVVSMGDYAASGGYYIACNADYIVAQPATLTGSIGVFGLFFTGQKFLEDKLGIYTDGVKTNESSDILGFNRPMTDSERTFVQHSVEEVYNVFVKHVAQGRQMAETDVRALGEGRIWSGIDAQKNGLVDELGGLEKAIQVAKEKAGLDNYSIVEYPVQKDMLEQIMADFSENTQTRIIQKRLGTMYKYYDRLEQVQRLNGIQTRLPFFMDVN